jgi:hypothetical protein
MQFIFVNILTWGFVISYTFQLSFTQKKTRDGAVAEQCLRSCSRTVSGTVVQRYKKTQTVILDQRNLSGGVTSYTLIDIMLSR